MKILYLGDGKSCHIRNILNYFSTNNYEIFFLSQKFTGYYSPNIKLIKLPRPLNPLFKFLYPVIWFIYLKYYLNKIQPDIFETIYITVYGWLASFTNYKYILSTFGSDIMTEIYLNPIYKFLGIRTINRASQIICCSNIQKIECLKYASPNKVNIIYLGIDTNVFNKSLFKV